MPLIEQIARHMEETLAEFRNRLAPSVAIQGNRFVEPEGCRVGQVCAVPPIFHRTAHGLAPWV